MASSPSLTHNDRAYRREKLVNAYCMGAGHSECAERFKLSENYVLRIVRNEGVSRSRRAGRRSNPSTREGRSA
jgi:hypothetical protein